MFETGRNLWRSRGRRPQDLRSFRGYCRGNDPRVGSPRRNFSAGRSGRAGHAGCARADLSRSAAECPSGHSRPLPTRSRPGALKVQPSSPTPEWTKGRAGRTRPEVVTSGPEALIAVRRPGQVTDLSEAIPEDPRPVRGMATEETVALQEAPHPTVCAAPYGTRAVQQATCPPYVCTFTFVPRAWLIKAPGAPPARGGWLHFPSRDPERGRKR